MLPCGTGICCYVCMYVCVCIFFLFLVSIFFSFSFYSSSSFFNLVLINRRNGPRYQRVLASCAFLTGVIPEGLILSKMLSSMFVYVLFYINVCTGLILWFLNSLWFDDLRAE